MSSTEKSYIVHLDKYKIVCWAFLDKNFPAPLKISRGQDRPSAKGAFISSMRGKIPVVRML